MEGVPGVTPITTQPKLQNIQRKVQDFCGWRRYFDFFLYHSDSARRDVHIFTVLVLYDNFHCYFYNLVPLFTVCKM